MIDVTCAIIIKEGKILATQRSEKMALPLKWEFPGGKVNDNESAIECIFRELKEELNIEIEILSRLTEHPYDYGEFKINLIPFVSIFKAGDIILTEHKDYKWLAKEDLRSLDWAPADIPVFEEFLLIDL